MVKCEVTNPIGRSEQTTVLNIAYAPMFVTRPTNVAGMIGERISLMCEVDANPRPSYKWYKITGSDHILVGNAANLTLEVVEATEGKYECVASTKSGHYAAVKAQATVYVKDKPKISRGLAFKVQEAPLDGEAHVNCEAISVPMVEDVEWLVDGQTIIVSAGENSGKYAVLENRSRDSVKSTLVIRETTPNDFRDYSCRVTNALGTDTATFKLIEQGKTSKAKSIVRFQLSEQFQKCPLLPYYISQ